MAKRLPALVALLAIISLGLRAEAPASFDQDFLDRAMRVELYLVGDAAEELVTVKGIVQEPLWPESRTGLLDGFNNGRFMVKLYDVASNRLLYSRGFDTMFGEYRTTAPAIAGVKRVFPRSVRVPWPRRPVLFVIELRDKKNLSHPIFSQSIDPADYHLVVETPAAGDFIYRSQHTGDPQDKVDLVFVAEGYTTEDREKFKADVDRFRDYLFALEPYRTRREAFNVTGLFRPSPERGMDEPRQGSFKKTLLDASFNAFDLDRYMLIEDGHRLREVAAQVPYDAIVVLVNSPRYGGGGIYNDYCVTTVDNERSRWVFVHEFGHSFAGLADEYYASDVAYNDFYPPGVEPLEPNITALLDPAHIKWADLLSPGVALPTDWGKDKIDAFQAERQKNRRAEREAVDEARRKGRPEDRIKKVEEKYRALDADLAAKLEEVRRSYRGLEDKVGAFEGAGYASHGLYRPMVYCLMIYSPENKFCLVCQAAISRMINFYSASHPPSS
jgi:hypothetical protein